MPEAPLLRIGAVSLATGVAVSTLRSWERRYGMPLPARTAGGHRLYPQLAVVQVRDVRALIASGASTSAAAAAVLAGADHSAPPPASAAVPLAQLLLRTRAARAENHRLRTEPSSATAAASASLDQLHARARELQADSHSPSAQVVTQRS